MKDITFWAAFTSIILSVVLLISAFHMNDVVLFAVGTVTTITTFLFYALFNMYKWRGRYEEL